MSPTHDRIPRAFLAFLVAVALTVPRVAQAEASADDPQGKLEASPKRPSTPRQTWKQDGTWGWFLMASSIFVGGAITSVGLTVSCSDSKSVETCERRASLLIWSGIGLGAVGSVIGLTAVAAGRDRVAAQPTALTFKPASHMCKASALAPLASVD